MKHVIVYHIMPVTALYSRLGFYMTLAATRHSETSYKGSEL